MMVILWFDDGTCYISHCIRIHTVIVTTLMGLAADTTGAIVIFYGLGGTHVHGASSLLDSGLLDRNFWWRKFTSLCWMVMVEGHLMVW